MPEGHQFTVGLDVAMTPCGPRDLLCHCMRKDNQYSKAIR